MPVDSKLLIRRQEALVMLIHTEESVSGKALDRVSQGLKLYQDNLFAKAANELKRKYPVVAGIIGAKQVKSLAIALLKLEQLNSGSWSNWGEGLVAVIRKSRLLNRYPYLADLAEFEWLIQVAEKSSDHVKTRSSVDQLTGKNLDNIEIDFLPGLNFLQSPYPIFEIWGLSQPQHDCEVQQETIKQLILAQIEPCFYAVSNQDSKVDVKTLSADEYKWLVTLQSRKDVSQVLELYPNLDSWELIASALKENWVVALRDKS